MPASFDRAGAVSGGFSQQAETDTVYKIPVFISARHACGYGGADLEDAFFKAGVFERGVDLAGSAAGGNAAGFYGHRGFLLGAGVQLCMEESGLYDGTLACRYFCRAL